MRKKAFMRRAAALMAVIMVVSSVAPATNADSAAASEIQTEAAVDLESTELDTENVTVPDDINRSQAETADETEKSLLFTGWGNRAR